MKSPRQSDAALCLTKDQYKQGLADYLTVLNAQQSYLQAQQNQVQSAERLGTDPVPRCTRLGAVAGSRPIRLRLGHRNKLVAGPAGP